MYFGQILQQLRKDAGLSQAELASKAGITLSTLQQWEMGRRSPVSLDFVRVAEALGQPVGEFRTMTAERAPQYSGKAKGKAASAPKRGRPKRAKES